MAATLLVSSLLDVSLGDGRLVIVDGVAGPAEADVLAWAGLATTVSIWLIGLIAGVRVLTRGTGAAEALRHGVTHLPAFAIGLVASAGWCRAAWPWRTRTPRRRSAPMTVRRATRRWSPGRPGSTR